MKQSKRVFYFDALRAMAIIGIVFCHAAITFVVTGINNSDFYISAFFDCFRDFSIPIFVMLSGALLLNKNDSLKKFFKKRLSRLFIPFLFWVLVYIAYSAVYIKHGFYLNYAIDVFFGTSSTFGVIFWFIWMIIIVYVGIFIINKINHFGCSKTDGFDKRFFTILAMLSVAYIAMVHFGLFDPYKSKLTYFISFMSYIFIGYYLANNDFVGERLGRDAMIILTLILSVSLYFYYIFGYVVPVSVSTNHFSYLGYFNLLILAMSSSIFLLFKYLDRTNLSGKIQDGSLAKPINLISRYSFGIYLSHYMILSFLKMNLIKYVDFTRQSPLFWIPFFVIITTVLSLAILQILSKIPYIGDVAGRG